MREPIVGAVVVCEQVVGAGRGGAVGVVWGSYIKENCFTKLCVKRFCFRLQLLDDTTSRDY